MKAVVIHAAGDLRVDEVEDVELGPRDVRVRVGAGGICGSDLHYYRHGGFGAVRLRQPMILGHEVAGTIVEVGAEVTTLRSGQKVAVNPGRACGHCRFCQAGQQSHCLDMRFLRQRDAVPARAGRLSGGTGVRRSPGASGGGRGVSGRKRPSPSRSLSRCTR